MTESLPQPAAQPNQHGVLTLPKRRLQQILSTIIPGFALISLWDFHVGAYTSFGLEIAAAAFLGWALRLNSHGKTAQATTIMLTTLVLALCALAVAGEGLFDEALLTFPGLLIFASAFGSRRLLVGLTTLILVLFVALYGLHLGGVRLSVSDPLDIGRPLILSVILVVTGLFVWLLAEDLRRAMAQLESDKNALQESHQRIEVLAHRDTLTNLPNRALAKDRLEQMLMQAKHSKNMVAVMFLDLDNFKTVNDSLGHAAGDALLCKVADRLMDCVRETDTVARLAGDEFLLLLGDLQNEEVATIAAKKVMQQLGDAFSINGLDVVATASLGVAMYPRDGAEMDDLLKNADMAMYRAKDAGRNACCFFDFSMNESMVEHLHLASGLRTAMTNGELFVFYQSQFDLRTGQVMGAEALLRWKHPSQGYIPPAKFIPVAERTGLINEIGAWVLEQACSDVQAWRTAGLSDLVVAINVSPIQFRRDDIERKLANALENHKLPGSVIELEITESLLVADAQHVSEVLQRLRSLGVTFAIDDFGTGYSNLGYLQRFAVNRLKIDQTFVRQMVDSAPDEGLVRAIIEMAHCLGLEVVAEGVEDAKVLQRLQSFGCEFGQGYYWSQAMPSAEFAAFVKSRSSFT